MNEAEFDSLRELSWQRALTPAEDARLQQYLVAHPEAREEWQADTALTQMLEGLPEAPRVVSNFTAQVLLGIERDYAKAPARNASGWWTWRGVRSWLPRFAVASLLVGFVALNYYNHESKNREMLAQSVSELAQAVPDPTWVEDMEPIQRLSDPQPTADRELLVLMSSK
jgi:hypothetical protein